MNDIKDGLKTTEFWYMVIALIANVLVIGGYASQEEADELSNLGTVLVNTLMAIIYGGYRVYLKTR